MSINATALPVAMIKKTPKLRDIHIRGATITSILVAAALAGVVAAVVAQLLNNQTKVMRTLTLREERENLLKHYRNTLISGWDHTLTKSVCGGGVLYNRDGNIAVPSGGLTVKSEDLYTSDADGWWQVTYTCDDKSGSIFAGDKYETTHGSGLDSETHHEVEIKVNFLQDKYPHGATKLNERVEKFYMHKQQRLAADTDCRGGHRTQMNFLDSMPSKIAITGATPGFPLYKGAGAIIQYDFNANYVKCSQVPLVKSGSCAHDAAIVGFWGLSLMPVSVPLRSGYKYEHVSADKVCQRKLSSPFNLVCEDAIKYPIVSGDYVCSHEGATGPGTPPDINNKEYVWYHPKIDELPDTPGDPPNSGSMRLITAYVGSGAGSPTNLNNFGNDGCQHNSDSSNHTYVSYVDGKGTAYCQTERHVVEPDIRCVFDEDLHLPAGFSTIDETPTVWGDDTVETDYEKELSDYGALDRGRAAGLLTRKERDVCWVLGEGAFSEFEYFGGALDPGAFKSGCVGPGYHKGSSGGRGPRGYMGSDPPGPIGEKGERTWNPITP